MAQPDAGARKENKCKSSSFSRKVTLIKLDDECTSFSEMRNLSDKSVIELSTRMTQDSIKDKILETFPYLEEKRSSFRCAALKKVDNDRKEFDFGGSRIWDGKTIRAKINKNSNLYILEQSREDRSSSDDDSPVLTSGISESEQESLENVEDTSIIPPSGSVEGGYPFHINFRKELPEDVSSGKVEFFGVDNVVAQRVMNTPALTGIVPSRLLPGTVKVTAWTNASDFLGETYFTYHAKMPPKEVKQLLYNPNQLSSFFGSLAEQFGFSEENECSVGDSYSSINVQDPASFVQMQKQQSVKILELLLYTAAEDDAQPFVEMLFSTSAGPIVFNYYKSRRPLPEDVAQANGNDELAQYLRDINARLSKEKPADTETSAVNWLELAKAVQQQDAVPSDLAQDQSRGPLKNPTENDGEDNSSNNFADSSSSAASDSEDKDLPVLKKFQEDFERFIVTGGRLSDDEAFKRENGFTVSDFLQTRRDCAQSLRRIADHIETVTRNTGFARTTGGLAVIGGLLALPFTGGGSFGVVLSGMTGLAGVATRCTADWVKNGTIREDSAEVKQFLGDLEKKDTVVNKEVNNLKEKADSMRSVYKNKAVVDWLEDGRAVEEWYAATGIRVGFQVCSSPIMAEQFAEGIARLILADIATTQGFASGMSGLTTFLGKSLLITNAGTVAKVISGSLAILNIAFAVWDIKEGVSDIQGSEHATAYRDAAEKIDKSTSQYQETLKQINEMFFSATSPQAH